MNADLETRIKLIELDHGHGAGWLARQAVEALAQAVAGGADPLETGRALAAARPEIGAIAGAVGRVLAAGRSPEQITEEAAALIAIRDRASNSIAVLLGPDLHGTVMTHSASATVREALVHTPPQRVVCTVSEPEGEGRPFAEDLEGEGLTVEVVADEDAGHAVETVDLLLLGADAVFEDGSLVNKTGTSGLAKAAHDAGVPVLVACETFKLAPYEPRDPEGERWDLTPPECVDRYVTEEGAYPPSEIGALVDRTPFLRAGADLLRG
jgi:translation initiation factor 2B subunit (eIF-2B alpha/beta/delta family)